MICLQDWRGIGVSLVSDVGFAVCVPGGWPKSGVSLVVMWVLLCGGQSRGVVGVVCVPGGQSRGDVGVAVCVTGGQSRGDVGVVVWGSVSW